MQDDLRNVYDDRYETGYRSAVSGYEIARWAALRDFLPRMVDTASVRKALDYGAGSGMHTGLWTELLPEAELWACDISAVARERLAERPWLAPSTSSPRRTLYSGPGRRTAPSPWDTKSDASMLLK